MDREMAMKFKASLPQIDFHTATPWNLTWAYFLWEQKLVPVPAYCLETNFPVH